MKISIFIHVDNARIVVTFVWKKESVWNAKSDMWKKDGNVSPNLIYTSNSNSKPTNKISSTNIRHSEKTLPTFFQKNQSQPKNHWQYGTRKANHLIKSLLQDTLKLKTWNKFTIFYPNRTKSQDSKSQMYHLINPKNHMKEGEFSLLFCYQF